MQLNNMNLRVGQIAPDFTLPDQNGIERTLSDLRGTRVLIYFYPKDDTPGCTKEACNFRNSSAALEKNRLQILGISTDSVKRHESFAKKYSLGFPLLADVDKKVVNAYGVWAKKKFLGREYMGTLRMSFLIDPQGNIEKIYEHVVPNTHAEEVLADMAVK